MPVFKRKVNRKLFVKLDLFERDAAVNEMTELIEYRNNIEAKKKDQDKVWKDQIDSADEQITDLAEKIKYGKQCEVVCDMQIDTDEAKVRITRLDTIDVVDERPMTNEDQIELTDENVDA
jgi:hypothetical protein